MSRYHKISVIDAAMEEVFLDLYVAAHKSAPERIILDLDATDDPLHGRQEGVSSTAIIAATATCRSTSSTGATCSLPSSGGPTSTPRPARKEEIARIVAHLRQGLAAGGDLAEGRQRLRPRRADELVRGKPCGIRVWARPQPAAGADDRQRAGRGQGRPSPQRQGPRALQGARLPYQDSWSRSRRVVGKAEHLEKGANPRFIVTSLAAWSRSADRSSTRTIYCQRGEMENRIKECQLDLYADRTSAATMRANQLRLWLSSLAYVLMEAVRRLAAGTAMANATAGSIRLKLLKIGAVVTVSVRRIKLAFASACPTRDLFALAHRRLRSASGQAVFDAGAACDRPALTPAPPTEGNAPTPKPPLNPGADPRTPTITANPPAPRQIGELDETERCCGIQGRGGGNPHLRCSAIPPTLSLPHVVSKTRLRRDGGGDAAARSVSSSRVGAAGDLVLPVWIEHTTSPLPRECSTTELRQPVPALSARRGRGWRGLGSSIIAIARATRRLRCGPGLRIDERRNGI